MKSRRFLIGFLSALIGLFPLYKLVQACSDGGDPYDYYPQFFPPSITQQPAYLPFHYTAMLKYYDEWYESKPGDIVPDANISEWIGYTGNAVPAADLDSFIYKYPEPQLSSLYYHIEKASSLQLSPEISENAFTKWFESKKDLEALGYLMFAKKCEPFAARSDGWVVPQEDTAKMSRLIKNGQQLYAAAKSDFIRDRYAFQVLRMAFYADKYALTLQLYTKLIGDSKAGGTPISARCLAIKAGALFHLKRRTEAAYLYSRAFDLNDNAKRSSFLSFDWSTKADISPVLALCKSPHEKAVVQVMRGLNNYEQALPQIQVAYAADPQVKGLDVLFTREINKIEERYMEHDLLARRNLSSGVWYYDRYSTEYAGDSKDAVAAFAKWKGYGKTLNAFAQKAATDAKNGRQAFWQLASAYLYHVEGDAGNTRRWLDAAEAGKMSGSERDLHRVINTLYIIRKNGKMNESVEAELLPSMQWLDKRAEKGGEFNKTYRDMLTTVLTTAYLQSGDTVKAVYCLARANRGEGNKFTVDEDFIDLPGALLERMSIQKLRELQWYVRKDKPTAWDTWLTSGTPYSADVLAELEGTKFLRTHQFTDAVETFMKVSPKVMDQRVLPDPFLARIRDVMETDRLDSAHACTKIAFAVRMANLSGKEDAASLFAYGTGLYSMTYYGKAHHAYDYYRSTSDDLGYYASPERKSLPAYVQDYYDATDAEQAFVKAAVKTTDMEFRAKCLWMAAKCWQKRCPAAKAESHWGSADDKPYYLNAIKSPYYLQLASLASTAFMKEAYGSCGYLRDYVAKRK